MKQLLISLSFLFIAMSVYAQDGLKEGDEMAAAGNYDGAAVMYRICMESNEQCVLKLFKLIYDEKIEPQFTDELFQLINPLAKKGNAEAQFYLGELYRKGIGGVEQSNDEALKWLQQSAEQDYDAAKTEWEKLRPKEVPKAEPPVREQPVREEPVRRSTTTPSAGGNVNMNTGQDLKPSKMPGVLFAVGGVAVVAGIAGTYLLPGKADDDFSASNETGTYLEVQKRNPVFLIAGGVIGGVCIGSGIVIKKKNSNKLSAAFYENDVRQQFHRPDNDMRLHVVAVYNGAGLRLTF